jgi:hypothetical protein
VKYYVCLCVTCCESNYKVNSRFNVRERHRMIWRRRNASHERKINSVLNVLSNRTQIRHSRFKFHAPVKVVESSSNLFYTNENFTDVIILFQHVNLSSDCCYTTPSRVFIRMAIFFHNHEGKWEIRRWLRRFFYVFYFHGASFQHETFALRFQQKEPKTVNQDARQWLDSAYML